MTSISIRIPRDEPQAYLICTLRLLLLAAPLALLLPLHLTWQLLKQRSPWAMMFLRIAARVLGARVRVYGKPLGKDVFFVANHISWHDIPILGGVTGTAFVAQHGVRKWPVTGWLAARNRTIFVNRGDKANVAGQISELRAAIAENRSVAMFPEGTTSDGNGLLPFKPSLFATLAPPPRPIMIQPVLLDFGAAAAEIAWIGEETGWESAWRAFTRPGSYPVGVHFLDPFDPRLLADRKEVCAEARGRILSAMARVQGH